MATTTRVLVLVPLLAIAAACGSDGDASDEVSSDSAVIDDASGAATDTTDATEPQEAAPEDTVAQPAPEPSGGGATLTLANGETFEFPTVLCALEPQTAAGSEILFTATSYDDPGLDITQFGDEGTVTGLASISVYDASYDTLWEAASLYEAFGGTIELLLDGSTISGRGSFYPAGDPSSTPVGGEVTANC